jgi:hypothetical protein
MSTATKPLDSDVMVKTTYTFKNGATITGTPKQIMDMAAALGETVDAAKLGAVPKGYYHSSSKGMIRIADMHTVHVVNALLLATMTYFDTLRPKGKEDFNVEAFVEQFSDPTRSEKVKELFVDLLERLKKGERIIYAKAKV